jgi:hypothetical protein
MTVASLLQTTDTPPPNKCERRQPTRAVVFNPRVLDRQRRAVRHAWFVVDGAVSEHDISKLASKNNIDLLYIT